MILLERVTKTYTTAAVPFVALNDFTLSVEGGEFVAVIGESGSGKSTLLSLIGGIDRPTSGTVTIDGRRIDLMNERALSEWRGRTVGIVFQFFQLLPTLTALENVILPMDFCNTFPTAERKTRGMALLERLGVADQADKLPLKLSGGQQQRVAVARALANAPAVLLADEPTGNLDSKTSRTLLDLMASLAEEGQTIVMVTHDRSARAAASRIVELVDGRLASVQDAVIS